MWGITMKMKMLLRKAIPGLLLALLCSGTVRAQGVINDFNAYAEGEYAVLEWNSGSEDGLSNFQVERSFDGLQFIAIATLAPQGDNSSYRYEDHDPYKNSSRTYYYRIRALMSDGTSSLSSVQSVTLWFSGIQQTWGSIKALFR